MSYPSHWPNLPSPIIDPSVFELLNAKIELWSVIGDKHSWHYQADQIPEQIRVEMKRLQSDPVALQNYLNEHDFELEPASIDILKLSREQLEDYEITENFILPLSIKSISTDR